MAEPNFTPGPFLRQGTTVYALNNGWTNRITIQVMPGWRVEHSRFKNDGVRTSMDEAVATAQLLTAAPDLFASGQALLDHVVSLYRAKGWDENDCAEITRMRAALAEAVNA